MKIAESADASELTSRAGWKLNLRLRETIMKKVSMYNVHGPLMRLSALFYRAFV